MSLPRSAAEIMVDRLGVDLYEDDLERVLDLGHTCSTVIESADPSRHGHGESVTIGIGLPPIFLRRRRHDQS
ncbi:hypothetical protein [Streptomyces sp. NPDC020141]|uniref:3-dehydroquinate synthase family protein n=1 Tax=Streptomyces sp. NPDC020141 TaxID=3365065 RepID=UPI00378B6464